MLPENLNDDHAAVGRQRVPGGVLVKSALDVLDAEIRADAIVRVAGAASGLVMTAEHPAAHTLVIAVRSRITRIDSVRSGNVQNIVGISGVTVEVIAAIVGDALKADRRVEIL